MSSGYNEGRTTSANLGMYCPACRGYIIDGERSERYIEHGEVSIRHIACRPKRGQPRDERGRFVSPTVAWAKQVDEETFIDATTVAAFNAPPITTYATTHVTINAADYWERALIGEMG